MRDLLYLFGFLYLAWRISRLSRSVAVQRDATGYLIHEFDRIERRTPGLTTVVAAKDSHLFN